MVTRMCAYKDCDNYYNIHDKTRRNVTLFAFPKQPDRAKLWRELAAVHPKSSEQLFMCSKHFDPKYIAKSNTRSKLVGEAVPYAYKSNTSVQTTRNYEEESFKEIEVETTTSPSQESYYINMAGSDEDEININTVESSTTNVNFESAEYELVEPESLYDNEIKVSLVSPSRKRLRTNSQSEPAAVIQVPLLPSPATEARTSNTPAQNAQTVEDSTLVDVNEVSTFNFKGEQYVQMSLEYYLREKREMHRLLTSYKKALKNIKTQFTGLDV
ncbi:uncharacterized protein Dwil_GK11594 [Drosophila willistoni]|uniref:THAP-type domain-containing protein n=1 Tax=Drosophila willistoni TaxID=7260 RepID=B4N9B7_DROWI|nr:uncharacterized protein LOC6647630 [Drosophila willistoni]EDW80550.1 uncharacterized protein Dwil_GK11594 [Drosophila willistoni]